jgi:hypothetical protein
VTVPAGHGYLAWLAAVCGLTPEQIAAYIIGQDQRAVSDSAGLAGPPYPMPPGPPSSPGSTAYLPTMAGTQLIFDSAYRWSLCRWCRVLLWLRAWGVRDRHQRRRHPQPQLTYLGPLSTAESEPRRHAQ